MGKMRTVKEVSELTGISVRTLHYYDEIGLLSPTKRSEAEYRYYDDEALKRLRQILFFREYEVPLGQIKSILDNPELDQNQILRYQMKMLETKRDRLNRLIASIGDILKGEDEMDFTVFGNEELAEIYEGCLESMTGAQKEKIEENFGSLEEYRKRFFENAVKPEAQQNFQKAVEWYGGRKEALEALKAPRSLESVKPYIEQMNGVYERLAEKIGADVKSPDIREIMAEYDDIAQKLYLAKNREIFLLEMAENLQKDKEAQRLMDERYGAGAADYIGQVIEAYYKK